MTEQPKNKYAFLDFDGVLYEGHVAGLVLRHQIENGLLEQSYAAQILDIYKKYKSSELSQAQAASIAFPVIASAIKGKPYETFAEDILSVLSSNSTTYKPYAAELINILKDANYSIYICTLNGDYVADAIVRYYELDGFIASKFAVEKGIFTGNVHSLMFNKNTIADIMQGNTSKSIAIGDSENDIPMLSTVELPIAINPDYKLRVVAEQKNWTIANDKNIIALTEESISKY